MNIFYLDSDPKTCAQMHCDKHVVKMIIEYAQLLSTAHRVLDGTVSDTISASGRRKKVWALADHRDSVLYTATHVNHPSAIWCRENLENYHWLYRLFHELCHEYTYRYGKVHACARLLDELRFPPTKIPLGQFFAPTPAMPPELKILADVRIPGRKYNVLKSYHNYYIQEKASFAKWKNRNIPEWFANAYV
jgi:hypothetical protein